MRGFVISLATAAFVVAGVYLVHEADEPQAVPHELELGSEPAQTMGAAPGAGSPVDGGATLRDQLLHATPAELGLTPVRGVWGVLMERGYAKGVATAVALTDGTASLYISTGGSVVGGRSYAPARAAALKLCEQAAGALGDTAPVSDFPAPAKGRVKFYVLAEGGVRTVEGDLLVHAGDGGPPALAPLIAAGDALLDGLREGTSRGYIR